jgi:hypothetical protein
VSATDDARARVSHNEAVREDPNEAFRSYVQSTAFSLSLGRTHIRALVTLDRAIAAGHEEPRMPVSDTAIAGLARRGLVRWLTDDSRRMFRERPRLWSDVIEVTVAGKLVLLLLAEAGLASPMRAYPLPPPPPGWTDPRPKMVLDVGGARVEPSERERAAVLS